MLVFAEWEIWLIPPTKRPGNKGAPTGSALTGKIVGRQPQVVNTAIAMASDFNVHGLTLPNGVKV
jgi:hypothetical protein